MSEEKLKRLNTLMYFLVKEAARQDFTEFLEEIGLDENVFDELKEELKKIGITQTYIR